MAAARGDRDWPRWHAEAAVAEHGVQNGRPGQALFLDFDTQSAQARGRPCVGVHIALCYSRLPHRRCDLADGDLPPLSSFLVASPSPLLSLYVHPCPPPPPRHGVCRWPGPGGRLCLCRPAGRRCGDVPPRRRWAAARPAPGGRHRRGRGQGGHLDAAAGEHGARRKDCDAHDADGENPGQGGGAGLGAARRQHLGQHGRADDARRVRAGHDWRVQARVWGGRQGVGHREGGHHPGPLHLYRRRARQPQRGHPAGFCQRAGHQVFL